jgi:PAS domain S-box-containing protein
VNDDDAFAALVLAKVEETNEDANRRVETNAGGNTHANVPVEASVASDVQTAVDAVESGDVDCVVTAYALPDGTGVDLVESVGSLDDGVPVILFTGQGTEGVASEALQAGVTDYIPARAGQDDFGLLANRVRMVVAARRERARANRATERFRQVVERTTDAVYAVDDGWRIEYVNDRMAERVGRDPNELVGRVVWEEFPTIAGTELETRYRESMATGDPVTFEHYLDDPFDHHVEVRAFPDEDGLTVFSRETTERRARETRIERAEAVLRDVDDIVFVLDEASEIGYANPAAARAFGYTSPTALEGERLDRAVGDAVSTATVERFDSAYERTLDAAYDLLAGREAPACDRTGGEAVEVAFEADTETRYLDLGLTPLVTNDGPEVVVVSRDVTERSETRRRLERTNGRLESLIDAAPSAIVELGPELKIRRWNRGATEIFGWPNEAVVGTVAPVVSEEDGEAFETYCRWAFDGEVVRREDLRCRTDDGSVECLLSVAPVPNADDGVRSVLVVLEDITERKRLERRLRELQRTARRLNTATSVEEVGQVAVEAATDVLGLDVTGLWVHDEAHTALVPVAETASARDRFDGSPRLSPGDGLAWESFDSEELRVYEDIETEERTYDPDTGLENEIHVPLGEYGILLAGAASAGAFSDVTTELFSVLGATVEAAMVRAHREKALHRQNDRLDEFASVVAHDLRNPIAAAMAWLEIYRETNDEERLDDLEQTHERMHRLVDDLLVLARETEPVSDAEPVEIETAAVEAWGFVDTREGSLEVDSESTSGPGVVVADRRRLVQSFENLFQNAVEHSEEGVTVRVGGDETGFYVEDDGPGVPEEDRERVFERGYSSREHGTGFGLAIVEEIADAHGWSVRLTEGRKGGTRVEFETGATE